MAHQLTGEQRAIYKRGIDVWRRAGRELEKIQARELWALDSRQAIRNLFGDSWMPPVDPERRATSGLVERQAWFAKLRR